MALLGGGCDGLPVIPHREALQVQARVGEAWGSRLCPDGDTGQACGRADGAWPRRAALETFGWEGRRGSELFVDTRHGTAGGRRLPGRSIPSKA